MLTWIWEERERARYKPGSSREGERDREEGGRQRYAVECEENWMGYIHTYCFVCHLAKVEVKVNEMSDTVAL